VVFGVLIALIACHFGLQVKPNTESLSSQTTTSVVTSITVAISSMPSLRSDAQPRDSL
jgi:phospholipid/cholesterol/gamma-HCH transport system permease protein